MKCTDGLIIRIAGADGKVRRVGTRIRIVADELPRALGPVCLGEKAKGSLSVFLSDLMTAWLALGLWATITV